MSTDISTAFEAWMEEARKTLRETPRAGEHEVMDALLNDFATNPPQMKNGEAETESEVCGRLREYCDLLDHGGGANLPKSHRRIVDSSMSEYRECSTCAAKPGSPTLCPTCLHNRSLVMDLNEKLTVAELNLENVNRRWEDLRAQLANVVLERDQWKAHAEDRDRGFEMEVRRRQKSEAERDVYADESRCLRKRLEEMAEDLGVSVNEVVGSVRGVIRVRDELKQECDSGRQNNVHLTKLLYEGRAKLERVQAESEGRRVALLEVEADRRKEWQRAENAEVAPLGGIRDQLSEVVGSLMYIYAGNPMIKGLPEIVDDLRRVRDRLASVE